MTANDGWNAGSTYESFVGGIRFPICQPEPLTDVFAAAGLSDVACDAVETVTEFSSFGDYWEPFLGGTGPAPSFVASLDDARRRSLAELLERTLPRTSGGSIPLVARAWAVRGGVE